MTKLKTLKDLGAFRTKFNMFIPDSEIGKFVHKGELKQEAIKWVKAYRETEQQFLDKGELTEAGMGYGGKSVLMKFFNITEEDLK